MLLYRLAGHADRPELDRRRVAQYLQNRAWLCPGQTSSNHEDGQAAEYSNRSEPHLQSGSIFKFAFIVFSFAVLNRT